MCSDPEDPTPSCDGSGGYPPNIPHPNPPAPNNGGGGGDDGNDDDNEDPLDLSLDLGLLGLNITKEEDIITIYTNIGNKGGCSSSCQLLASGMGFGAAMVDIFTFGANAFLALAIYGTAFVDPVLSVALMADYKLMLSPLINIVSTVSTFAWATQGVLTGDNVISATATLNTSSQVSLERIDFSTRISQDTIASGMLDGLGWGAPEPISATGVGIASVTYDIYRNPAPLFFPYEPLIPAFANITINTSVDFP